MLKNAGPKGGPGMPEWGMLPIPKKLVQAGVRDMVRISDGRMSGTSYGACILHVAPESFVGGPLAFVQTGDEIEVDVAGAPHPSACRRGGTRPPPRGLEAAAAALSARLRRHVLRSISARPTRAAISISSPARSGSPSRKFIERPKPACRGPMKIGLFDHVEHGERPLATLFDERLTFVQAADEAGIYCLHVAEHHATPLNMVPVPGVYLGAVARATKRMRLGPLVYLLPLYSPLRLIEEICMLDHLSYGRMEVGVGRGVSPFELKYHKVEHDDRATFSSTPSIASAPA